MGLLSCLKVKRLVVHCYGKGVLLLIIDANQSVLKPYTSSSYALHHLLLGLQKEREEQSLLLCCTACKSLVYEMETFHTHFMTSVHQQGSLEQFP